MKIRSIHNSTMQRLAITCILSLLILAMLSDCHTKSYLATNGKNVDEASDLFNTEEDPTQSHIDPDLLPNLLDFLKEMDLMKYLNSFIKLGVTETMHLLRLAPMDYHIMSYDWDNMSESDISRLKMRIEELRSQATISEKPKQPELDDRKFLTYGRIYMQNSVQSFEYVTASFGGISPIGYYPMHIHQHDFQDGCIKPPNSVSLTGKMLIVKRGNCTFLHKAINAFKQNATALIIVNTEERLESPSSGLGIDSHIQASEVLSLEHMSIISVSNSSWAKFEYSFNFSKKLSPPLISIVPLKCGKGGKCSPVTEEESAMISEVSWGDIHIKNPSLSTSKSFQYLTSTFGGQLPDFDEVLNVVRAEPSDACSPLLNKDYFGKLVVAERGNCRFDVKALNVQLAGGRMLIVVNLNDSPLQRLGGQQPTAGKVGITSILVSRRFGEFLDSIKNAQAVIEIGQGSEESDEWIELAFTEWKDSVNELIQQIRDILSAYKLKPRYRPEILYFLKNKLTVLENKGELLSRESAGDVMQSLSLVNDEL